MLKKPFSCKYIIALFWVLSLACEKEVNWVLDEPEGTYLVVNGNITNEQKIQSIRLSRPVKILNEMPKMVSGAKVRILVGEDSVVNMEEDSLDKGVYKTSFHFMGVVGKEYTLDVEVEGNNYHAKTYMVPVVIGRPLRYKKLETDTSQTDYYQLEEDNAAFGINSFMREVFLDWSMVPGFENIDEAQTRALIYIYTFNTLSVNQIFKPDKKNVIFPKGTKARIKKYSLTEEHATYLRAVLSETDWKGGYFDQFSANPPTNLSEGGLGYFAASSVMNDSTVIQ